MRRNRRDPSSDIEALVEAWQGPLIRYARRLVRNDDTAQDVVQEAFLRYLKRPPRESESSPNGASPAVSSWLFRVTHNLCIDVIRKESRMREAVTRIEPPGSVPPPSAELMAEERRRRLAEHLETLDERQRTLVVLKYQEHKSYKEIAEMTGLTVSNVGFILHTAVRKLGRSLAKEESV